MTKVQRSDMSGNLYLFETCGNNWAVSVFTSVLWWPWVGPASACLYTYMVLYCWVSMACFPSAGPASEPLAEAPDVDRVLVCDGPCTHGVFRNYMLVSKSVLLRALLPGYLERCKIAEASHTAVSRSPFKHSCCGFSVRFQTLRPCCFLSSQFLKLSPQQRPCKKKPLCGAAPQRARKMHYKFQEHARLRVLDHIVKFWKCVNKWWQSGPELWVEHWVYCARFLLEPAGEIKHTEKRWGTEERWEVAGLIWGVWTQVWSAVFLGERCRGLLCLSFLNETGKAGGTQCVVVLQGHVLSISEERASGTRTGSGWCSEESRLCEAERTQDIWIADTRGDMRSCHEKIQGVCLHNDAFRCHNLTHQHTQVLTWQAWQRPNVCTVPTLSPVKSGSIQIKSNNYWVLRPSIRY